MAKDIKLQRAKGRPMLTWVGKKPLTSVKAYPAQHIESFNATDDEQSEWTDWPDQYPQGGLLFHGDNKDVLAHLLANGFRGKIKLIYIDPPFDSGADYVRKVQLRGVSGSQKLDGEEYTLGEQIQYTDIWTNDNYLQFMYERLTMLRELLAEDGTIFLHCDPRKSHYLRCLLDEVFSPDNCVNQICWKRSGVHSSTIGFGPVHDTILFYKKGNEFSWTPQYADYSQEYITQWFSKIDENGRKYGLVVCSAPGERKGTKAHFEWNGLFPPAGRHWAYTKEKMEALAAAGLLEHSKSGTPYVRKYLDESKGVPINDIWTDTGHIKALSKQNANYPTQKPENLLERIIKSTTSPRDIILDAFIGSGSTSACAQKLGRRWIGCDINKGAIQTTAKRLQNIMREQSAEPSGQTDLLESEANIGPAQLSFSTWRVNDYDLQIQHNEAVNLACDYIGITRQRTDSYFDGSYGQQLAKIIPFNHPLTPLDLEQLKTELEARPQEDRDITLVCMGIELAAQSWVERHNQNRPINRIKVIELRTDDRYGAFIQHEPLTASIDVRTDGEELIVEVTDVLSPSILKRLNMEQGVFRAQIDDWRAVVDCIMIDSNYNGKTFNVQCSDVPAKKTDLVSGQYLLPKPPNGSTVAVKIIDMLGEETVVSTTV